VVGVTKTTPGMIGRICNSNGFCDGKYVREVSYLFLFRREKEGLFVRKIRYTIRIDTLSK